MCVGYLLDHSDDVYKHSFCVGRAPPVHDLPISSARCCCSTDSIIAIRDAHDTWVMSNRYAIRNIRGGKCTVCTGVNTAVVLCSSLCDRK